jgi:hypothetical protein
LRNIGRDAHFEGLARTRAENQTTVKTPPEGDRNMSAPTERADPDLQLQAAWLAQVSDPTEVSVSEQAPRQSGHSPRASTDSLEPVDRATEQHVALPLDSVLRRRSGLVMISLIGFILALALPLVIGIRRGVALSFRVQLSRGGGLSSASTKRRVDASINSGLFIKQGLAATAVKADVGGFGGFSGFIKRINAISEVIVPDEHAARMAASATIADATAPSRFSRCLVRITPIGAQL